MNSLVCWHIYVELDVVWLCLAWLTVTGLVVTLPDRKKKPKLNVLLARRPSSCCAASSRPTICCCPMRRWELEGVGQFKVRKLVSIRPTGALFLKFFLVMSQILCYRLILWLKLHFSLCLSQPFGTDLCLFPEKCIWIKQGCASSKSSICFDHESCLHFVYWESLVHCITPCTFFLKKPGLYYITC